MLEMFSRNNRLVILVCVLAHMGVNMFLKTLVERWFGVLESNWSAVFELVCIALALSVNIAVTAKVFRGLREQWIEVAGWSKFFVLLELWIIFTVIVTSVFILCTYNLSEAKHFIDLCCLAIQLESLAYLSVMVE